MRSMTFTSVAVAAPLLLLMLLADVSRAQKCGKINPETCESGETCCSRADTVTNPFCMESGSTDKCCYFKGYRNIDIVTACRANQECCSIAYPIESDAHRGFCCTEGYSCCNPGNSFANQTFFSSACCKTDGSSKCCKGLVYGFCCNADEVCDNNENRCLPPGSTTNPPSPTGGQFPNVPNPNSPPEAPITTTAAPGDGGVFGSPAFSPALLPLSLVTVLVTLMSTLSRV